MPDRFLPPLRFSHRGTSDRDARILRDRQRTQQLATDRSQAPAGPYVSARMLVQVYDGGSMGAAAGLYYLTHPVLTTGTETEGGTATLTTDTATTIPVVLVRGVPAVGDYLTAYAAGGRWCAEIGSSGPSFDENACGCTITDSELTLTLIGGIAHGWCFCFPEGPTTVSINWGVPPSYTGVPTGWIGTFSTDPLVCEFPTYLAVFTTECRLIFFNTATESQVCEFTNAFGLTETCSPLNITWTAADGDGNPDGCIALCHMSAVITS